MKKVSFLLVAIALAIMLNSCNKDSSDSNATSYPYSVHMTDAPGPFEAVNIDLKAVEVTGENGKTVTLNTTAGIYNLLDFSNGTSILIAKSTLYDANVKQIRLILGPNNNVVIGGISYPLSTPSAEQTGLKLLVNKTLTADIQNDILIDFDANTSIIQTGNGTYKLQPVLRTIVTEITGTIKGTIHPINALAMVTATSSTSIVYSSIVNALGEYQILGLPAGTYTFTVTPLNPLFQVMQVNVTVEAGATTDLGAINL